MQAQLCCLGIDDGKMVNVADPPPDVLRVPKAIKRDTDPYDEYERDGTTKAGLIRYVKVKHD